MGAFPHHRPTPYRLLIDLLPGPEAGSGNLRPSLSTPRTRDIAFLVPHGSDRRHGVRRICVTPRAAADQCPRRSPRGPPEDRRWGSPPGTGPLPPPGRATPALSSRRVRPSKPAPPARPYIPSPTSTT